MVKEKFSAQCFQLKPEDIEFINRHKENLIDINARIEINKKETERIKREMKRTYKRLSFLL
jgi:hypothetical protein